MEVSLYELTIKAGIDVPANWKEITSYNGTIIGWETTDGAIIRPSLVFEEEKNGEINDLENQELEEYGIIYDYRETSLEPEEEDTET